MKKLNEINELGKWDETLLLWSISGKFIGLCKNEQNILMAALAYRPDIRFVSKGFNSYRTELKLSTVKGNAEYYYKLYSKYIYILPKNIKKVYSSSLTTTAMKRRKWITVVVLSKTQRIVFDFNTHSYFELNEVPKQKVKLCYPSIDEILSFGLGKCTERIVKITLPIEFPRDIFIKKVNGVNVSRKDDNYGLLISTNPDIHTEYFKKSKVENVIKLLEKKNITFVKDSIYKELMSNSKKIRK